MISFPTLMLLGALLGGAIGAIWAKVKGGNRKDMLHSFGVFGILGFILTVLTVVIVAR
ncbi:hypothetical protein [Algirhabdus cladophorae]|uniref:hypothetical protein n=1 Tax=Algirhabdus cladophorae TaxID=3377108 RepID=UPI003B849AF4